MISLSVLHFLKCVTPTPVRKVLVAVRSPFARAGQHRQVRRWKEESDYAKAVANSKRKQDVSQLQNKLPNSGGIPLADKTLDPAAVAKNVVDPNRRGAGVAGFEGLALDD